MNRYTLTRRKGITAAVVRPGGETQPLVVRHGCVNFTDGKSVRYGSWPADRPRHAAKPPRHAAAEWSEAFLALARRLAPSSQETSWQDLTKHVPARYTAHCRTLRRVQRVA
jgi:hypothetical protein